MKDRRFFCVRGFMKSGTNWLGSLLSSHADISCVGEFHWEEILLPFNQNLKTLPVFEETGTLDSSRIHLEDMIKRCLVDAAEDSAIVIGERTPHTIVPVTLRNVPYISIIRDGRDVLVSRAFHLHNHAEVHRLFDRIPEMGESNRHFEEDPWYFQKHPEKLLNHEVLVRESVRWWRNHLERDMAAVEQYPKLSIRFVRYEDIHRDVKGERKKLFEFLDVDPKRSAEIDGHLKPGFKSEQPTQFLRKGAVGDWKNYFNDQTKEWFKEEAGDMLIQQGYEESMDW